MFGQLWATKHPHASHNDAEGLSLHRTLGPWGLTALGIGVAGVRVFGGPELSEHQSISCIGATLCGVGTGSKKENVSSLANMPDGAITSRPKRAGDRRRPVC